MDAKQLFLRCLSQAGSVVARVEPNQMNDPTPDTEWSVSDLTGHILYELQWTSDIVAGKTIDEVGDKYERGGFDGSLLEAWRLAAQQAQIALDDADVNAPAHLSYGDTTVGEYLWEAGTDQLIHSWDLGTAIGLRVRFEPDLAQEVYDYALPRADGLAATGLFAPPVPVPDDADIQTKLLALYGRKS